MRLRPPITIPLLLSSLVAASCGGDDEVGDDLAGDVRFVDLAAAERSAAIELALAGGVLVPLFHVLDAELANDGDPACPSRDDAGGVTTYAADDCTSASGPRFDGRLIARNAPTFGGSLGAGYEPDPARPMVIELDGWTADGVRIDGRFEQSTPLPVDDQAYSTEVDYEVEAPSGGSSFRLSSSCIGGGRCTIAGHARGAGGAFAIDGDLSLAGEPAGWLVLRGADELRLDLDAIADGCAPYAIDGVDAGEHCFGVPEPAPTLEITSAGGGCGGEDGAYQLDLSATITGTPAHVTTRVVEVSSGLEETHELLEIAYDAELDQHAFQRLLSERESGFAECSGRDLTYVVTATDGDGASVCLVLGADPEEFPECAW